MEHLAIRTNGTPKIVIENATGDLRIKGWNQREIRADAEGKKSISHTEEGESLVIKCHRDCYLRVPNDSQLEIKNISGEAFIKSVEGPIQIGTVAGNLALKDTGGIEIEQVGGNLSIKQSDGDAAIKAVGGNADVKDVDGHISIDAVGGNLLLKGEPTGLRVKVNGDATLKFDPEPGGDYHVEVMGSISCRVAEESHAKIKLASEGEMIRVRTEESSEEFQVKEHELTLGDGSSTVELIAQGAVQFSTYSFSDPESFSLDFDIGDDFAGLADEITQHMSEELEEKMEALNEQLSHLTVGLEAQQLKRAHEAARQAEKRVAAAQRRLERRMAKAQRNATQRVKRTYRYSRGANYSDIFGQTLAIEGSEPVGDEERRIVLEMVQNNKISVEDAEKLLAAMEGRGGGTDMEEAPIPSPAQSDDQIDAEQS